MFKKFFISVLLLSTSTLFAMSLSKLNTASKEELMQINGIGEVKAAAIIKERRKGKFKSFGDVERVEGVGTQLAANIKNDVKMGEKATKVSKSSKRKSTKKSTKAKKDNDTTKETKAKKSKKSSKRKVKSMNEKKDELKSKKKKTKAKKTKSKKTKSKKSKKTKSKN